MRQEPGVWTARCGEDIVCRESEVLAIASLWPVVMLHNFCVVVVGNCCAAMRMGMCMGMRLRVGRSSLCGGWRPHLYICPSIFGLGAVGLLASVFSESRGRGG